MSGKYMYHPKYYSKKLLNKECNNEHVYAQNISRTLLKSDILGDTYIKAVTGFRDDSIRIYHDFIKQYEDTGTVTGCTLDWVHSVLKIIVDIEENRVTDSHGNDMIIDPNMRAQATLNALGLSGEKVNPLDMLGSVVDLLLLHIPQKGEGTKSQTKLIIDDLKKSNLYKNPHLRVNIDNYESMKNIISKRRVKTKK